MLRSNGTFPVIVILFESHYLCFDMFLKFSFWGGYISKFQVLNNTRNEKLENDAAYGSSHSIYPFLYYYFWWNISWHHKYIRYFLWVFECLFPRADRVFKLSATLQRIKKCNPFQANFLFLYPLKHQKTPGFLTFSVGIEI